MDQYFIFWASTGLLREMIEQGKRCKGYPYGVGGEILGL